MLTKRQAREFCFQYFFHLQLPIFEQLRKGFSENNDKEAIAESINDFKETTNTLLSSDQNQFVLSTVVGTLNHYSEIETLIQKYLKNWKTHRLSKVDFTILLLATYELCFDKSNPLKVIINEAIEISKKFGNIESASFVNATLDAIAKNEVKGAREF